MLFPQSYPADKDSTWRSKASVATEVAYRSEENECAIHFTEFTPTLISSTLARTKGAVAGGEAYRTCGDCHVSVYCRRRQSPRGNAVHIRLNVGRGAVNAL